VRRANAAGLAYPLDHELRSVGQALQDAVCARDDDLYAVADAGWNPTIDTVLASGEYGQYMTRYAFMVEDSDDGYSWHLVSATRGGGDAAGVDEVHDLRQRRDGVAGPRSVAARRRRASG